VIVPERSSIRDEWLPVLEALADDRIGGLPAEHVPAELSGLVEGDAEAIRLRPSREGEVRAALERAARGRTADWVGRTVSQGEVLDAFARHCEEELEEVELLSVEPMRLMLGWRRERATVELRVGTVAFERLADASPVLILCPLSETSVAQLAQDQRLAARLAICDLVRLEKVNAVRSSVFVYFEWFLRDAYGVKLLTATMFTRALIARGVLSLGMG
jgi:hypothetical protein